MGEIQALIRAGHTDFNELKAITRIGMGACGGKTCTPLLQRLMQAEGVAPEEITPPVKRPLFIEVPLGILARGSTERPPDPGVGPRKAAPQGRHAHEKL